MLAPSRYAERVLDELSIDQIDDLHHLSEIAWARGALVDERDLGGAEARLSTLGRGAVICVSSRIQDTRRRRFAIAHELGHYEMRHRLSVAGCGADDLEYWAHGAGQKEMEYQSNQFAAELLLPRRFAAQYCVVDNPSLDCVSDIAERFQTSLTSTAIRFVDLGEDCTAVAYSQAGHTKWFHGSPDFREMGLFIPIGECPGSGTLADRVFEGQGGSRPPQRVRATEWLVSRETHIAQDATLIEQSWAMPSYEGVLTFLYIDGDLNGDP
jgi:Zn-dependent peptidase ImmA (M78 family)